MESIEPQLLTFDTPERVVCYQWGDTNAAETVLCVHGLTRNGRDFDYLARKLLADYRVVCIDMPGRGESPWLADPKGYNYPAYVACVAQVLKALAITRVHWVGTSMGGIIAMLTANAAPGLIASLVLNDIGCLVPAAGLRRIAAFAGVSTVFADRAGAEAALRERCASFGIRDEAHWQYLFAHSIQTVAEGFRLAFDPAILRVLPKPEEVIDVDLWQYWEAVTKIPVLLIRGAESDILLRQTAADMQSRHPRLTLHEITATGHAPALMAADQTTLIHEWIKNAGK